MANGSLSNRTENAEFIFWWIGLLELFVFATGSPMNLLVFYLTYLTRKRRSVVCSHKRVVTELFVVSMTAADLLFCLGHSPAMYANYSLELVPSEVPCLALFAVTHASTVASSLSLLGLNINKFLHLHRPLHYFLYMNWRRAIASVLIGWSVSIGWGLFFVAGPFTSSDSQCNLYLHHKSVYVVFATVFFVVPTLVSLVISVYVAAVVVETKSNDGQLSRSSARRARARRRNSFSLRAEENEPTRAGTSRTRSRRRSFERRGPPPSAFRSHIRRISFVFTTTIWSSLTVLPYRVAFIVSALPRPNEESERSYEAELVYFCLFAAMTLNAAGNPLITILTQREYSRWVKKFSAKATARTREWIPSCCSNGHEYRSARQSSDEITDAWQWTNSPSPRVNCKTNHPQGTPSFN